MRHPFTIISVFVVTFVLTFMVSNAIFFSSEEKIPVTVYAEYDAGSDPGTHVDDTLQPRGLVREVEVREEEGEETKRYSREWYLDNVDNLRVVDLVWVEPSWMARE